MLLRSKRAMFHIDSHGRAFCFGVPNRPGAQQSRRVFIVRACHTYTHTTKVNPATTLSPLRSCFNATNTNSPPWGIVSVPHQLRLHCLAAFELFNRGIQIFSRIWHTVGTPSDPGTLPRWRLTKLVGFCHPFFALLLAFHHGRQTVVSAPPLLPLASTVLH